MKEAVDFFKSWSTSDTSHSCFWLRVVFSWRFNSWTTLHGPPQAPRFVAVCGLRPAMTADDRPKNALKEYSLLFHDICVKASHSMCRSPSEREVFTGTDLRTEDKCVQLHTRRCSYRIFVRCQWTGCIASGYAASNRVKPHLLSSYGSLAYVYAHWMSQLWSFHRRLILYTAFRRVQLDPDRYEAVRQTVL
jgi:hypothetical protein